VDPAKADRNLDAAPWCRWTLFVILLALGGCYIAAYDFFLARSENFISVQRNQAAATFSGEHPVELPILISFGVDAPDNARLGGGWHLPDHDGVWSAMTDAWIELRVSNINADFDLRFDAIAFVDKRHPQTITVTANGARLGSWMRNNTNASDALDMRVPKSLAQHGRLVIDVHTDYVDSPFRLRTGPDQRRLGIRLNSIELR